MASKVIELFIKKALFKKGGAMASNKSVKFSADALEKRLKALGIDPNTINTEAELNQILAYVKQAEDAALNQLQVLSGKDAENALKKLMGQKTDADVFDLQGNKLNPNEPIMGGTQDDTVTGIMTQVNDRMKNINKANKKLGELLEEREILYGKAPKTKDNPKVQEREMFKEANERFNKTDIIADTIARITSMEPVAALKEANKVIRREGIYKNLDETQSKKILQDSEDWIFQRDPNDLYDYNKNRPFRDDPDFDPDDPDYQDFLKNRDRDDYYTGGIVDVEPSLSDIGHGSDALMARTRLMSPGSQATTSTGLNYLLAEDNDNIRVPFKTGTDQSKRAFLKLLATLGGGIATLKSGLLSFGGKGATKKLLSPITTDNVAGKPEWFDALVTRVIKEGDDVTKNFATKERQIVHKKKLNEDETAMVTQDLDEGSITVELDSPNNMYGDKVQLRYKKSQPDKRYRKNPDTYLRNEAWNDEIINNTNGQSLSYDNISKADFDKAFKE
jgi:hypothetical protein